MYNDCYEECFINPKVSATVKTIILLNLIIQMWLFFRYHEKEIIKTHIKEIQKLKLQLQLKEIINKLIKYI